MLESAVQTSYCMSDVKPQSVPRQVNNHALFSKHSPKEQHYLYLCSIYGVPCCFKRNLILFDWITFNF